MGRVDARQKGADRRCSTGINTFEHPLRIKTMLVTDEEKRLLRYDSSFSQHVFIVLFQQHKCRWLTNTFETFSIVLNRLQQNEQVKLWYK